MFNHSIRSRNLFGYGIHSWPTVEEETEGETETQYKALKMYVVYCLISYDLCLQLICLHLCTISLDIFITNLILDKKRLQNYYTIIDRSHIHTV